MASPQVVLLTPLESFHPLPLPSSYRINRINSIFPVVQPFYFQTLTKCNSDNLLVLIFIQIGGGYTPHPGSPLIACGREASANFFGIISFADPYLLTRIESYSYKNHGEGWESDYFSRRDRAKPEFQQQAEQIQSAASRTPLAANWHTAAPLQGSTVLPEG